MIASIFRSLEGYWSLQRLISGYGTITGQAVFKPCPKEVNTLTYREEGVLLTEDNRWFNVFREYIYCYQDENISVFFADRKFFHTLHFYSENPPSASVKHPCKCDTYEGTYTFLTQNAFKVIYNVTGPSKNYTITTQFSRGKIL